MLQEQVGWPVLDVGNGLDLLGWGGVDGKARDSPTACLFIDYDFVTHSEVYVWP